MEIHRIKDSMYRVNFSLIVNCSEEELYAFLKKKYGVTMEVKNVDGMYFSLERAHKGKKMEILRIVWLRSFKWWVSHMALLVHELQHFAFKVLREIGLTLTNESEEAYTWYLQHLTQESLWALSPTKAKEAKKVSARTATK